MRDMSVVDYDPRWPVAAADEIEQLRDVLGEILVRAHHIGSTSVPGLAAKPVIDLLLEVVSLSQLEAFDGAMRDLGYEPRGEFGIPRRRYYPKGGDRRTHHVHAFRIGDSHIGEHLAFRDYLRAHPEISTEYARVKRQAASRHRHDPEGYVSTARAASPRASRVRRATGRAAQRQARASRSAAREGGRCRGRGAPTRSAIERPVRRRSPPLTIHRRPERRTHRCPSSPFPRR